MVSIEAEHVIGPPTQSITSAARAFILSISLVVIFSPAITASKSILLMLSCFQKDEFILKPKFIIAPSSRYPKSLFSWFAEVSVTNIFAISVPGTAEKVLVIFKTLGFGLIAILRYCVSFINVSRMPAYIFIIFSVFIIGGVFGSLVLMFFTFVLNSSILPDNTFPKVLEACCILPYAQIASVIASFASVASRVLASPAALVAEITVAITRSFS